MGSRSWSEASSFTRSDEAVEVCALPSRQSLTKLRKSSESPEGTVFASAASGNLLSFDRANPIRKDHARRLQGVPMLVGSE